MTPTPTMHNEARTEALALAPQLADDHTGPHAPGTLVLDTDNDSAAAYIIGMGDTWATVIYADEPDTVCACGNSPGRWVTPATL